MVALNRENAATELNLHHHRGHDQELAARIDSKTFRQVRDLNVAHEFGRVILRGHSESYYVKQLATHAVLDLLPDAAIDNAITVNR